ncbi:MAG: amino acid ABC transporter permease [Chloroflexota bacterium]
MPTSTSTTTPTAVPVQRPIAAAGPIHWLRNNLFRSWLDTLLTIFVGIVAVSLISRFFQWITSEAQWTVITSNFRVLMQGLYPIDQGWRLVVAVIVIVALAGISWGIWGHMFTSTTIMLVVGTFSVLIVSILGPTISDSTDLARYFRGEIVPLLEILRVPILILVLCLLLGYAIGQIAIVLAPHGAQRGAIIGWLLSIPVVFLLVRGLAPDTPGLPLVPTSIWGGLLLTFMMAFVAIVSCFPLGILLALGRSPGGTSPRQAPLPAFWFINFHQWYVVGTRWWRNLGPYPIFKLFCALYIEFFRGVPLITVFFTANLLVPFALGSTELDSVVRAMIALTLFEAAYIAEIVRGGLQALPPGQLEAAKALGLSPLHATLFITMPQALRTVIPALVGQFITMFKDTSLVAVVGLLDLLGIAQGVLAQQQFAGRQREMYVFVALVFFIFSFGMSRAAQQLERSGSGRLQFER